MSAEVDDLDSLQSLTSALVTQTLTLVEDEPALLTPASLQDLAERHDATPEGPSELEVLLARGRAYESLVERANGAFKAAMKLLVWESEGLGRDSGSQGAGESQPVLNGGTRCVQKRASRMPNGTPRGGHTAFQQLDVEDINNSNFAARRSTEGTQTPPYPAHGNHFAPLSDPHAAPALFPEALEEARDPDVKMEETDLGGGEPYEQDTPLTMLKGSSGAGADRLSRVRVKEEDVEPDHSPGAPSTLLSLPEPIPPPPQFPNSTTPTTPLPPLTSNSRSPAPVRARRPTSDGVARLSIPSAVLNASLLPVSSKSRPMLGDPPARKSLSSSTAPTFNPNSDPRVKRKAIVSWLDNLVPPASASNTMTPGVFSGKHLRTSVPPYSSLSRSPARHPSSLSCAPSPHFADGAPHIPLSADSCDFQLDSHEGGLLLEHFNQGGVSAEPEIDAEPITSTSHIPMADEEPLPKEVVRDILSPSPSLEGRESICSHPLGGEPFIPLNKPDAPSEPPPRRNLGAGSFLSGVLRGVLSRNPPPRVLLPPQIAQDPPSQAVSIAPPSDSAPPVSSGSSHPRPPSSQGTPPPRSLPSPLDRPSSAHTAPAPENAQLPSKPVEPAPASRLPPPTAPLAFVLPPIPPLMPSQRNHKKSKLALGKIELPLCLYATYDVDHPEEDPVVHQVVAGDNMPLALVQNVKQEDGLTKYSITVRRCFDVVSYVTGPGASASLRFTTANGTGMTVHVRISHLQEGSLAHFFSTSPNLNRLVAWVKMFWG
ncbi:hypothetical protein P7C70_g5820, partial [Phenoliferia sp. Uapishka_3]